jgi:Nucleotidyl transferase AbiEii toxin, Type IV TA system
VPLIAPRVPSSASPLADLLADLDRALTALGIRWYLFGAQAAILYGVARLTADVDVTVDAGSLANADLVAHLAARGFALRVPDAGEFVEKTRVLPLVHAKSRIPVDVVLAGPGLEELFFSRAEERNVGGVRIPVAAAEDIVTMKVLAGRLKDLDDVVSILRACSLDADRVRSTLRLLEQALDRRDLLDEFERLLRQASGQRRQSQ